MGLKKTSYLFKHLILSTLVLCGLVIAGSLGTAPLITRLSIFKPDLNDHPVRAIAGFLEATQFDETKLSEIIQKMRSDEIFLLDKKGQIVSSSIGQWPQR